MAERCRAVDTVGVCFMWPDQSRGCILEHGRKMSLTAPYGLTSPAILPLDLVVHPLLPASLLLLSFLNVRHTYSTYTYLGQRPHPPAQLLPLQNSGSSGNILEKVLT